MERDELIAEKATTIQQELEVWAKASNFLKPGEQIIFSMRIGAVSLARQEHDDIEAIKRMHVNEFFTRERLLETGCPAAIVGRIINQVFNAYRGPFRSGSDESKHTVGLMLEQVSEWDLLVLPNMGKKSVDPIIEALKRVGLHLKKRPAH